MNTFEYNNSNMRFIPGMIHPKGCFSKAAKQAFHDIKKDKDMKVHVEYLGIERKSSIILNEQILEEL